MAITIAGVAVRAPERELWPGIPRIALCRYWESVAEWALPHVVGRPLTLVRREADGTTAFLRHSKAWGPKALERVSIPERTKVGEYLVVRDAAGLVALAVMGIVEVHTWNTRAEAVELPDRLVFDLDPGPELPWKSVVDGARILRTALSSLGLESFPKTTGGAGLHVVVPLEPIADWRECLAFSREVARGLERYAPRLFTTRVPKEGRERKILVDYLRNNRTNTSVAAFSPRAREDAPVSVPLAWDELSPRTRSDRWTLRTVGRRLVALRSDPWRRYATLRQRLPAGAAAHP